MTKAVFPSPPSLEAGRPTITFVVPAYNASEFIRQTIGSLISQSRADWEVIVVDDGSCDNTSEIVQQLATTDPRVQLIKTPNFGVCAARNTGLAAATGTWITFLDADDWVSSDYVSVMMEEARRAQDVDMLYCGHVRIMPDGAAMPSSFDNELESGGFYVFARRSAVCVHAVATRRKCLLELGGFDVDLPLCEDWDLWQRLSRTGVKIKGVRKTLAYYRMREKSLSVDYTQMCFHGLTVLRRGFQEDPRVKYPQPNFKFGLSAQQGLRAQECYFTAWFAAAAAGSGSSPKALFDLVPRGHWSSIDLQNLSDILCEGLCIGARCAPVSLGTYIIKDAPAVTELFEELIRLIDRPSIDDALRRSVRRAAASHLPPESARGDEAGTRVVDVRFLRPIDTGEDIFTLVWTRGSATIGFCDLIRPVRKLTKRDLALLAYQSLGLRQFVVQSGLKYNPIFLFLVAWRISFEIGRSIFRKSFRGAGSGAGHSLRGAVTWAAMPAASFGSKPLYTKAFEEPPVSLRADVAMKRAPYNQQTRRADVWNDVFANPDPWNYTSEYETEKYIRTLDVLPVPPPANVLEIACAEGIFTEMLAKKVGNLHAVDISELAIERAKTRCSRLSNITFGLLDFIDNPILSRHDLIVCSEALYYTRSKDEVATVIDKIVNSLQTGGHLIMANHFLLKDDMSATGFDWDQPYGGQVIHDVCSARDDLVLEASIITDLYRIDRFRRLRRGEIKQGAAEPLIRRLPIKAQLEVELKKNIVWGGASMRRTDAFTHERSFSLPVLAYHRIAPQGPEQLSQWRVLPEAFEAQLQLLRSNGYYSVTSKDLEEHHQSGRPFHGRPVMITFDDGYQDFAEYAWPLLQAYDFVAEVFVVSDLIGEAAEWDRQYGEPARLMNASTLADIASQGVCLGSHMASHTASTILSNDDLLNEGLRSRNAVEQLTLCPVRSVAPPFGAMDDRFGQMMMLCGYKSAFTCNAGIADLRNSLFSVPRIEVSGQWTLRQFAQAVGIQGVPEASAPLVSVVIPAYNAERYIGRTLQSVRSQTYRNIEIIVVDDGSSDSTADIVRQHALRDKRVKLVCRSNGGVAAARNTAIDLSNGEFIAPVDADDVWSPFKIALQMEKMQSSPHVGLVYNWSSVIDTRDEIIGKIRPVYSGRVVERALEGNFIGNGSTPLIRKEAILEVGGYDASLRSQGAQGCEDSLLYFRISERYEFAVVPEYLTGYRRLPDAMSCDLFQMLRSHRLVAAEMVSKYPNQVAQIRGSEVRLVAWLFMKAVLAGKLSSAARLFVSGLRTDFVLACRELSFAIHNLGMMGIKAITRFAFGRWLKRKLYLPGLREK